MEIFNSFVEISNFTALKQIKIFLMDDVTQVKIRR